MCSARSSRHKPGELVNINVTGIYKPEDCRLVLGTAIKYILYVRNIIPYPYPMLYDVVKRPVNEDKLSSRDAMLEHHYKNKASTMITKVDAILQGFEKELNSNKDVQVREVAFLIGPTINCVKEVYLFKIPYFYPENSTKSARSDIMRHIFMNEDFMKFTCKNIQRTNMYVLVKKPQGDTSAWIHPVSNYDIPSRAPRIVIELFCAVPHGVHKQVTKIVERISILNVSEQNLLCSQQNKTNVEVQKAELEESCITEVKDSSIILLRKKIDLSVNSIMNDTQHAQKLLKRTSMHKLEDTSCHDRETSSLLCSTDSCTKHQTVDEYLQGKVTGKESTGSDGRIKQEEEKDSFDDELIWYIASEYLPYFKQQKLQRCSSSKRVKC